MSLKKEYFHHKIVVDQKDNARKFFAERELYTIQFLLREFYGFNLNKGHKILDLGSGDNFLKDSIISREISYSSLDIEDLDFEKDNFKFDNNSFDLIVGLAVIEHLKDPNLFLNEIMRVLKPGSFLFLSTPNWKYSKNNFFDDVTHVKPYSPDSLKQLLEIKGFNKGKLMPSLRCKSKWWYEGKFRFFIANYFLPFSGTNKLIPDFLKGKSQGMFALAKK